MSEKRLFSKIQSINIKEVSKSYGEVEALKDLSLEIKGGELLILIGPSGSGKTTTLRIINRLIEPDEGSIEINSRDIHEFDPVRLRRNIGYVIQQIGLFPHLNIKDNISIIPGLEGWTNKKIDSRVNELLDLVDLPHSYRKRFPHQLSGGQQQRVGLARAMAMDPYLLLMDEPFGALDPILRKQLQLEFLLIKEKLDRTIIFVTHDIEEAFRLGDRVAIMENARLIQIGKPNELILHPKSKFVADLVGSHKKFMHMDNLMIKDVMLHISKEYIFDNDQDVRNVKENIVKNGIELAVVKKENRFMGIVDANAIFNMENGIIGDLVRKIPSFSPEESVSKSLKHLKKSGESIAIVLKDGAPVGLVFINKLLLELI